MAFLLAHYATARRQPAPERGIRCPEALVLLLAQNGLVHRCTVTDGNCGLDSFGQGLRDVAKVDRSLANTNKYKAFAHNAKTTAGMVSHLRQVAHDWMRKNRDQEMWDGMSFGQLALAMNKHGRARSYAEYLAAVARDGYWIDGAVIHALCCHFGVDALVFQAGQEQMIVGPSLVETAATSSTSMLLMCLVNDVHFWAVTAAPVDKPQTPPDNGDLERISQHID